MFYTATQHIATHFLFVRSITGECNNVQEPLWGSINRPFTRTLPSIPNLFKTITYSTVPHSTGPINSTSELEKINWFGVKKSTCSCASEQCVDETPVQLPNPRFVSTSFFTDNKGKDDNKVTHMLTQFGQFLDHDLTLTPEEEEHGCCQDFSNTPSCFPIFIPINDPFYQSYGLKARGVNQSCLDHSRSVGFCSEGFETGHHEQFNAITSFVDASNVYGSTDTDSLNLREQDGTGKLKVNSNSLLPLIMGGRRAGDSRALEMPGLAAMHTVFVREHNRICDALRDHPNVDSSWVDEDYFLNARRILIAQMQKIVYDEYLPIVLGSEAISRWNLSINHNTIYNSSTDPTLVNSFGTAAFRFGHTMIQGLINVFRKITDPSKFKQYELGQNFFNLTNYDFENGLGYEMILTGLMRQKAHSFDRFVTEEVTNRLFANAMPIVTGGPIPGVGGDLISRNIQRGRDHGLPSYAAFYKHLHNFEDGVMDCWNNKPADISQSNWDLLKNIYYHPHHIDLFVGSLAEYPHNSGLTGKTFQTIIAQTFRNLKYGDRFFFSHKGNMNLQEYNEIKARTLADIICDNSKFMTGSLVNVFLSDSSIKDCRQDASSMNIASFQVTTGKLLKGRYI